MDKQQKKIRFIINPKSGTGKQRRVEKHIHKLLSETDVHYEICYTTAPAHAVSLSHEAAEWNYDIVVAVGGDGSVNEVARGIAGTATALGIIPTGSGNGLAHCLKIPFNIKKAILHIIEGKSKPMDSCTLNGRMFVSIAGVGFDAEVAYKFSKARRRGFWSYAKITFIEFFKYKEQDYIIRTDEGEIHKKALLVSFANSNQFGFNAVIAPFASVNDGLIDICIFRKPSLIRVLMMMPLFFSSSLNRMHELEILKLKKCTLIRKKGGVAHIDGDELIMGSELNIKINPANLKVIY